MKISLTKTYIKLFLFWPVFSLLISLTPFSSQLNLIYQLILFVLCLFLTYNNKAFWRKLIYILILPTLYISFFLVITYFGVDLTYSLKNRFYFITLDLVTFFLFYSAGNLYDIKVISSLFVKYNLVFVIISLFIGYLSAQLNGISQIRVISGLDIPFAISFALFNNSGFFYIFIFLIGALSSIKKTLIITSLLPFIILFFFKKKNTQEFRLNKKDKNSNKILFLFIPIFIFLTPLIIQFINATFLRLFDDQEDVYRLMQISEFVRLLKIHFPFGTGISTFGSLTKDTIPYNTFTSSGDILDGMSLHNTPMHVLLEGGLIITILYLMLYYKSIKRAYMLFKNKKTSSIGLLFFNLLIVSFVFGLFNQLHGQLYYFGLFGFITGTYYNINLVKK
jgi:hypothetical protein